MNELDRYNDWREQQGMVPLSSLERSTNKNGKRTIQLSIEGFDGLETIALKLGYVWGQRGNVTAMLEALGQGHLELDVRPQNNLAEDA